MGETQDKKSLDASQQYHKKDVETWKHEEDDETYLLAFWLRLRTKFCEKRHSSNRKKMMKHAKKMMKECVTVSQRRLEEDYKNPNTVLFLQHEPNNEVGEIDRLRGLSLIKLTEASLFEEHKIITASLR